MNESMVGSAPWLSDERRVGERRATPTTYPVDERRSGAERRITIGLTRPRDPSLAVIEGVEHDAIPSLAALGGHPLHPMIVPLPIGSFTLAVLSDLAFAATHDRFFARASRTLTAVGIVSGLGAAAFGALDFVGRSRVRDHPQAWFHAAGNVAAVGLSAVSLATRLRSGDRVSRPAMAMGAAVAGVLLVTGWLGGELSYRHRVGVTNDPGGAD